MTSAEDGRGFGTTRSTKQVNPYAEEAIKPSTPHVVVTILGRDSVITRKFVKLVSVVYKTERFWVFKVG